MHFNVKHNMLGILDTPCLKTDEYCLSKPSFIQTHVLGSDSIANTNKKVCYGKNRKEGVALLRTLKGLNGQAEISLKKHRNEKSDLEQIIHHLNYQREGLTPLGSIIAGDEHRLSSSRGMQAENDPRQIKSIRRPLAPQVTRDHGNKPTQKTNLQYREGCSIPRVVERKILKRQLMRLKIKRQEQIEGVKHREVQLEDMVGVYARVTMGKGSLNYKGKPRHSTETRITDARATASLKYQYSLPSVERQQTTDGLTLQESADWNMRNSTNRVPPPNVSNVERNPSMQAKSMEVSELGLNLNRNDEQVRLNTTEQGGNNVVHEAKRIHCQWPIQEGLANSSNREKLGHLEDNTAPPPQRLNKNRGDTSKKISVELVTVKKRVGEKNNLETKGNSRGSLKRSSEEIAHSANKALAENDAKKLVRTFKNKVILPFRKEQRPRPVKRTDLQTSDRRERYIKDGDSITKDNLKGDTVMVPNEEHNTDFVEKPIPLSAGKLQKLIRDKVLSQSQKSKKQANEKTVLLADYVRTLQKHMGIKDDVPESNSPDFSETPFMAAEKRFGSEDEDEKEPRVVDRRLEILQRQLVRLPASFNLLDGDLVED